MNGPAEGKLGLDSNVYFLITGRRIGVKNVFVCIHLKGYSLARVTHLDIEHDVLANVISPKRGGLRNIKGIRSGIEIFLEGEKELFYQGEKIKPHGIQILSPPLNEVLKPGQITRTWVGGKFGGIYIGFRKKEIEKLEEIAINRYGIHPR